MFFDLTERFDWESILLFVPNRLQKWIKVEAESCNMIDAKELKSYFRDDLSWMRSHHWCILTQVWMNSSRRTGACVTIPLSTADMKFFRRHRVKCSLCPWTSAIWAQNCFLSLVLSSVGGEKRARKEEMAAAKLNKEIHLIVVISLSMIITFGFHQTMKDLPSRDSVFQHVVIDYFRTIAHLLRSRFYDWRSKTSLHVRENSFLPFRSWDLCIPCTYWRCHSYFPFCLGLVFSRRCAILLRYADLHSSPSCHHDTLRCWLPRPIPRFSRDLRSDRRCYYLFRRMAGDIRGVEFDVTQPSITHSSHRTSSSVYFSVRDSLCIPPLCFPLCAERSDSGFLLVSFSYRHVSISKLKVRSQLILLFSFFCFHTQGRLHAPFPRKGKPAVEVDPSGDYFTGIDGEKRGRALGFGDFLVYNLLVLLALPLSPSSTIITQLWITAGSIISINIGHLLTVCLQSKYRLQVAPGLPLPVMTFTAYVILLQFIGCGC